MCQLLDQLVNMANPSSAFSPEKISAAVLKSIQQEKPTLFKSTKNKRDWKPAIADIAGNGADVASTLYALSQGAREGNPFLTKLGLPGSLALKGGMTLAQILAIRKLQDAGHPLAAKILGYGFGGGLGAVALNNIRVANSMKK